MDISWSETCFNGRKLSYATVYPFKTLLFSFPPPTPTPTPGPVGYITQKVVYFIRCQQNSNLNVSFFSLFPMFCAAAKTIATLPFIPGHECVGEVGFIEHFSLLLNPLKYLFLHLKSFFEIRM